ncbi:VOC family protein [Corynebacterium sp. ES2775-CONJ]|uniref:VOC family protein n=1 Tax=Corynebacterium sp. ES2775-CONJ TaxID=2974029 RepID=UPI00216AADF6|nr:VOC family protein [Corynebacterium sp. ES2775-CONJ]MCS4490393.1 VOC family protein [Corynebacterium sp. ES2775-CONJ]
MPAFQSEPGMPYWIDLTTSQMDVSTQFYEKIFGWEIEKISSDYRLARLQGLPVAGFVERPEQSQQPDTWVTYFQAGDIARSVAHVEELSGQVLTSPRSVKLGSVALLVDPTGALFGLVEPEGEDSFIAAGEPGTPVWHELTATKDFDAALDFYAELFGWALATSEDHSYATALIDGSGFAGIYNAREEFPPHIPSFWQTFLGIKDVDLIRETVVELGGEILREPFDSGFGRMMIIADPTGALVTLCNIDEPVEEGRESDPLEGFDLPGL